MERRRAHRLAAFMTTMWLAPLACSTSNTTASTDAGATVCGLRAQELDSARTCASADVTVEALCYRSPGPQAKSDVRVCAVDADGHLYLFLIASNWSVVESAGWSYAQESNLTPMLVNSRTAPLSADDLAACEKLRETQPSPIVACATDAGASD